MEYGKLEVRVDILALTRDGNTVKTKQMIVSTMHGVTQDQAQKMVNTHGEAVGAVGTGYYAYTFIVAPIELRPNSGAVAVKR